MALKRYEIPAGRRGEYTATVQLSDEDAKRLDAKPVAEKSRTSSNKARTASNKSDDKK